MQPSAKIMAVVGSKPLSAPSNSSISSKSKKSNTFFRKKSKKSAFHASVATNKRNIETVGGKHNPTIIPVMILQFTEEKWKNMLQQNKSIGEVLHENDSLKLQALDVASNKKNRVIVAQFASEEAIANTPHSPRSTHSISQTSEKSNSFEKNNLENVEEVDPSALFARGETELSKKAKEADALARKEAKSRTNSKNMHNTEGDALRSYSEVQKQNQKTGKVIVFYCRASLMKQVSTA